MTYDLSRATDRALRHVEVSAATGCPVESFAHALATGTIDPASRPALTLLFEEGDEDMLVDLVTEGASTFATLARLSSALLSPDHPTTRFLSDFAASDTSPIKEYVTKHRAQKGSVKRFILTMFREATTPITSRQISEAWVADRGLVADEATYTTIRKRIGAAIKSCVGQGLIEDCG